MSWVHRYVGLVVGAWLMLVGLSGTFLVFHKEIDEALYPKLLLVDHETASPDIDFLSGKVREKYPDRAILFYERYGIDEHESYPFVLSKPLAATPDGLDMSGIDDVIEAADLEVFLDPQTGAFLGQRPYWNWIKLVRSFHEEILMPGTGKRIVGILGLTLVTTVICGAVLWWRESKRKLRRSLRLNLSSQMPKLLRDIHTVGGIYIAIFLLIQGLSGAIVANWLPLSRWFTATFIAQTAPPPHESFPTITSAITANKARDIGLASHPLSDVIRVIFPIPSKNIYSVRMYPTDQSRFQHLRQVLVDVHTGNVVFRVDPDSMPIPDRILSAWMIWMHNGQFYGMPGRLIVLVTGMMLTLFFPTGLYIWYRKRLSEKAAAHRRHDFRNASNR